MQMMSHPEAEWLEADGLGGFASGTVGGFRTRRYQALLLTAVNPPTDRFVLVNGVEACIETPRGRFALSTQHYAPDVLHPDGHSRIAEFSCEPWPHWIFELEGGLRIEQELFGPRGQSVVAMRWRVLDASAESSLFVRLLMSGRDYHSLHRENAGFRFDPERTPSSLVWRQYDGVPPTAVTTNGDYVHEPAWYRNFLYRQEQERGLDCVEDLASPGTFRWKLSETDAVMILSAEGANPYRDSAADPGTLYAKMREDERMRRETSFREPLDRAADSYIVRRGQGRTIIAGYPWFTDWGRDTFISLRGLCLSRGRHEIARDILVDWAKTVSEGMLPNRFPDRGEQPEFNSVDASLWYIIAVDEYLRRTNAGHRPRRNTPDAVETTLRDAVQQILDGYYRGTRYGIHGDDDGLLACGVSGVQLTWMEVKIGDWVVTPRIGKPVEVEALWLNALAIGARFDAKWQSIFDRGLSSFRSKFWNKDARALFDVVDNDHVAGSADATIRPNQIFAVGGLPLTLVDREQAVAIVETVESQLLTPVGLRSLSPSSLHYVGHYRGGVRERDSAYHQGTVWPWLLGPFVDAWVRVRGNSDVARQSARERFVTPVFERLNSAGIGHIAEIADGDAPNTFRGCPFQAWSLGELIRLSHDLLADGKCSETSTVAEHLNSEMLIST
jgi:predicted glycogen debranching enzyme